MAKHDKTLAQIDSLNGGLHWSKIEALLKHYGATVDESASGSNVVFLIDGVPLAAHRPHPRKECGKGLVKRVRTYLQTIGRL